MGLGAAIDHTEFQINSWFDSKHHYLHHKFSEVNYSEFEYFDVLFKTKMYWFKRKERMNDQKEYDIRSEK